MQQRMRLAAACAAFAAMAPGAAAQGVEAPPQGEPMLEAFAEELAAQETCSEVLPALRPRQLAWLARVAPFLRDAVEDIHRLPGFQAWKAELGRRMNEAPADEVRRECERRVDVGLEPKP